MISNYVYSNAITFVKLKTARLKAEAVPIKGETDYWPRLDA